MAVKLVKYISYVRFSTARQRMGDSEARQLEYARAWAKRKGVDLDDKLVPPDRGRSGYHGAHRKSRKGKLGLFLGMVRDGDVPAGSVLVVERVSRLSREGAYSALKDVVFTLIEHGVIIQFLSPELAFDRASLDGPQLHVLIALLQSAFQESRDKAEFAKSDWKRRRKAAAESKRPVSGAGPAWLRQVDGKWQVIRERAAVVRKIYQWCIDGCGVRQICRQLNDAKVPPFGWGERWNYTYVTTILRNPAVFGRFQPRTFADGKREKAGGAVEGYYPAVLDQTTFGRAKKALDARVGLRGPRGKDGVRNLLTGVLRSAADGEPMFIIPPSAKSPRAKYVSSGAPRGLPGSNYATFPVEAVEAALLHFLRELKPADLRPQADGAGAVEAAAAKRDDLRSRVAELSASLKAGGNFAAGLDLLRQLNDDLEAAEGELARAEAEAACPAPATLADAQDAIRRLGKLRAGEAADRELVGRGEVVRAAAGGEELRSRLKQRVRELVSEAWLAWESAGGGGLVGLLQLHLKAGPVRYVLLAWHRSGHGHLTGPRAAGKAGADGWPDLRNYAKGEGKGRLVDLYDELTYGDISSLPFRRLCGWGAEAKAKARKGGAR
jgi:DNA invertase Pin-like site-specific DNA recombinase